MTNSQFQPDNSMDNNSTMIERIKKRMKLKTTVMIAIIALLAVCTGTLAWFTLNTFSSVNDLEMTIGTGAQLLVSTEDHGTDLSKYVKVITNEMINDYLRKSLNDNNADVSKILLDPSTSDKGIDILTRGGKKRAANTEGYVEFPIYFIGTKDMYVHLTSDNTASNKNDGSAVSTSSTGAKADVVNCPRVSFEDNGSTRIWEPNQGSPVAGQTTFDLPKPMSYTNNTRLFHLDAMKPKKIMVRLWVEGEDPQCDDDVQDAQLTVAMCFMGTDENNEAIA
ncbi:MULTISPECIES: neuropeptide Y receptor family protein [unclassified Ruminococcus]|uniref:neuropeptide Y receptor family protein n=1 Tax=unclassified Ruminococcus TaxID=2608920 RepID=UPI00210ED470|nr:MULTISPECIES: neuropeptide Y receptor family protein [unclassified Ruminococcus]MCQ4021509.1 hypothetical protein [Ruminococcus sp. zg-924]MCQ4113954.1 hypothetical protein [Ruminococcus sp. zg-921]